MKYIRIYGLDVKDRLRGENRSKLVRVCAHTYMARNCGAFVRARAASICKNMNASQNQLAHIHSHTSF